jgi:amino acid transporter
VFDTFCLGLNAIIESGIFIFPGLLAKEVGSSSIRVFGVCGVLLVFVALCYAELGSVFRQNGGCYVYAKEAFGPLSFPCCSSSPSEQSLSSHSPVPSVLESPTGSFSLAVFLALWALQGFEVVALPSGESGEPERAVPIATVGSLLCASLLYVLIQAVAVGAHAGLASAGTKPLAEAAARFMGPFGGGLMALGAVSWMEGFNAGNAVGSSRFLYALAHDRHLPPPHFRQPIHATIIHRASPSSYPPTSPRADGSLRCAAMWTNGSKALI